MNLKEENKECLHNFRSVYYGSEWEVECRYCDKNVYQIYSQDDANEAVEIMLESNRIKKQNNDNSKFTFRWENIFLFIRSLPSRL
jgi:hypothetical protein